MGTSSHISRPCRPDEHSLGLDRVAVYIAEISPRKSFHTFGPLDERLGPQRTQGGATQVAQRNGAGELRLGQPVAGRLAEDVVEHQRADAAMHPSRRPFIRAAEVELAPGPAV